MGIKCVLTTVLLGTVFANHGNNVYKCMPLDPMKSDSSVEMDSESNCNIKEYIREVFGNMSNRLCNSNGTDFATKEDMAEMKRAIVEDISTTFRDIQNIKEDLAELKRNFDSKSTLIMERLKHNPIDCEDIQNNGFKKTDTYTIFPKLLTSPLSVRCDMDTSDGGWIVIQRRVSDSDFYKPWSEYEEGFGNLSDNFWLGLRYIHLITQQAKYGLRVDLTSIEGETAYAYYDEFSVGAADSYYKLTVGSYSGTAGDSLKGHNGMKFSTYDQDNDINGGNCAVKYHGAWWYSSCHSSNLNGDYGNTDYAEGPVWYPWKGHHSPMMTTEMKIRRIE